MPRRSKNFGYTTLRAGNGAEAIGLLKGDASIERVDARGIEFDLIGKPYKRADLAMRVRQVLDGHTGSG